MTASLPLDFESCWLLLESDRWWEKISIHGNLDECWIWNAANVGGYGTIGLDGKVRRAPRIALVVKLGRDLRPGMQVHHLCNDPRCVNEDHLVEATPQQNCLAPESMTTARRNLLATHCPKGHLLGEGNNIATFERRGWRACLTCNREKAVAQRAAIKAAIGATGLTRAQYLDRAGYSRHLAEQTVAVHDWMKSNGMGAA